MIHNGCVALNWKWKKHRKRNNRENGQKKREPYKTALFSHYILYKSYQHKKYITEYEKSQEDESFTFIKGRNNKRKEKKEDHVRE